MSVLMIDNYDSFTYNLVQYLGELGAPVQTVRNDAITVGAVTELAPNALVLSPGPRTPKEAGISLDLLAALAGKIPILGVCLGHQAIGVHFGAKLIRSKRVMHGKVDTVSHQDSGLFRGLPERFNVVRYHSLSLAQLPDCLEVTAQTDDGEIMGVRHKELALEGVQFHPESIESEWGHQMLLTFLQQAGIDASMPSSRLESESTNSVGN